MKTALAVLDAECALCAAGARVFARLDRMGTLKICPAQSPLGRRLLADHGLDPDDPESWLFLEDGWAYTGLEGMARLGRRLGGAGRLMAAAMILPGPARRKTYRWIARRRLNIFGRADLCALPDGHVRRRLIQTEEEYHALNA